MELLYNKMAKPPWIHFCQEELETAARTWKHNAWTKEAPEHL